MRKEEKDRDEGTWMVNREQIDKHCKLSNMAEWVQVEAKGRRLHRDLFDLGTAHASYDKRWQERGGSQVLLKLYQVTDCRQVTCATLWNGSHASIGEA